ncbi:hypothetical protein Tco_1108828 [Tanacetum coccineum]
MAWVVCSEAVLESCDIVLIIVMTASCCICDAVSSHCREILEPCWCSTWMAFGGNTRDLGSFGEETYEIIDLHQILEEILLTGRGDGVASINRRRHDPSSDGVRDLVMASGRGRLNEDLESSMLRRRQDYNVTPSQRYLYIY